MSSLVARPSALSSPASPPALRAPQQRLHPLPQLGIAQVEADRVDNAARLRDGLVAVLPRLGAVGR